MFAITSAGRSAVLLFCTLLAGLLQGQSYTNATELTGVFNLGQAEFYDLAEDWNGFIWVASEDGLYRFDGTQVVHYTNSRTDTTLPHKTVYSILVDDNEKVIWLGTKLGVCKFDPSTEHVRTYVTSFDNPNSIADNLARIVYKDRQDEIWISCFNQGLSKYRRESDDFENYFFNVPGIDSIQIVNSQINVSRINSFLAVVQDAKNDSILWLGAPVGLISFNKYSARFEWLGQGLTESSALLREPITTLKSIDHGLIVGTWSSAYHFDYKAWRLYDIPAQITGDQPLSQVVGIHEIDSSELWISYQNGMVEYDPQKMQVMRTLKDNPAINQHYGIRLIDSQGRIWAQASHKAVMYDPYNQIAVNHWMPEEVRMPPLVMRELKNGTVTILTRRAELLYEFDITSHSWSVNSMQGAGFSLDGIVWVDVIAYDADNLILVGRHAAYMLNTESYTLHKLPGSLQAMNVFISAALLDSREQLWIGTRHHGLFRLNIKTGEERQYIRELYSPYSTSLYTWLEDLVEDNNGNIWVRLARSFAVYHPSMDTFTVISHHRDPSLTFRYVRNFALSPDGDLWIASTESGIGAANVDKPKQGLTFRLTEKDGLLSDRITWAEFDDNNVLWILSDLGISTYDVQDSIITNFPWDRGIPQATKMIVLSDGLVAISGASGMLTMLDHASLRKAPVAPEPYITRVMGHKGVIYNSGNNLVAQTLRAGRGRDYLSVEYSALGFSNPKQFSYQLHGVNQDWVETFDKRSASYSNLEPGTYTFSIRAKVEGSAWSDPKQVEIYLAPMWYDTWAFRILLGILLIAIGVFIYRARIENARKEERMKAEFKNQLNALEMKALRSQMNPHFLFNSINSIEHYIITRERDKAADYLNRFSRLMRLILQNSRSQKVPLSSELEALQLYVDLERIRFKVPFEYEIELDPSVNPNDVEIPPMLIQPFVENAIWHGIQHKNERGHIVLSFRMEDELLICSIDDDGVGRKAASEYSRKSRKKHKSVGLKITEERISILNQNQGARASFAVIDKVDEMNNALGTRIVLKLPT